MKVYPLQQGKNINVFLNSDITSIRDMILEHYDDKEPQGTLIFNWPFYDFWDIKKAPFELKPYPVKERLLYDLKDLKIRYNKLILLETEHLPFWVMNYMNEEWLQDVDEIWVMWLETYEYFKTNCTSCWDKLKWVPMRYTSQIEYIGNSGKYEHNLGFFGQMPEARKRYIDIIESSDWSFYHINGLRPEEVSELVRNTKFILDIPFYPDKELATSQNVVRIFENVCMGKHILTIPSTFNYFDGMVTVMEDPIEYVKDLEWKASMDFSNQYKERTYTDNDFENYKQECISRYTNLYGDPFDRTRLVDGIWEVKNPLFGRI